MNNKNGCLFFKMAAAETRHSLTNNNSNKCAGNLSDTSLESSHWVVSNRINVFAQWIIKMAVYFSRWPLLKRVNSLTNNNSKSYLQWYLNKVLLGKLLKKSGQRVRAGNLPDSSSWPGHWLEAALQNEFSGDTLDIGFIWPLDVADHSTITGEVNRKIVATVHPSDNACVIAFLVSNCYPVALCRLSQALSAVLYRLGQRRLSLLALAELVCLCDFARLRRLLCVCTFM